MKEIVVNALNCMMNATRAGKTNCTVPSSKLLIAIIEIMEKLGYIGAYSKEGNELLAKFIDRKLKENKVIGITSQP